MARIESHWWNERVGRREFFKGPFKEAVVVGLLAAIPPLGYSVWKLGGRVFEGGDNDAVNTVPAASAVPTEAPKPPQAVSTPEAEVIRTPLEAAIDAGRIELNGPNEWERYFTAVTAEEAESLLAEANQGITDTEQLKLLLPFDPRLSPNLRIVIGRAMGVSFLGFENIGVGTVIYAPFSGRAEFTNSLVGPTGEKSSAFSITNNDGNLYDYMEFSRESVKSNIGVTRSGESVAVQIGQVMGEVVSEPKLLTLPDGNTYNSYWTVSKTTPRISLVNLAVDKILTEDGKIAFIATDTVLGK